MTTREFFAKKVGGVQYYTPGCSVAVRFRGAVPHLDDAVARLAGRCEHVAVRVQIAVLNQPIRADHHDQVTRVAESPCIANVDVRAELVRWKSIYFCCYWRWWFY